MYDQGEGGVEKRTSPCVFPRPSFATWIQLVGACCVSQIVRLVHELDLVVGAWEVESSKKKSTEGEKCGKLYLESVAKVRIERCIERSSFQ